ncbi:MAG TPA: DUF4157 domain-containing protein, partial [Clostridia bacterium]|nr:DUF4157 domain-containing protein [Clostridia bacterium]
GISLGSLSMTEKGQNNSTQQANRYTGKNISRTKGIKKNTSGISELQSTIGNRGVSEMLAGNFDSSIPAAEVRVPQNLLEKMEQSFGTSFSDVKVHEDPKALTIGARAYTQGNNIVFAPGQFSPHTQTGQSLLGHELSHVVQQKEGKVRRTAAGSALTIDQNLESLADRAGERASAGRISAASTHTSGSASRVGSIDSSGAPVQASFFSAIGSFAKKAWSGIKSVGSKAINFGMKAGKSFVDNGGLQMLAGMYANKQSGGGAMQGFVNSGGLNVASGMLGGGQEQEGQAGGQQSGGGGISGLAGILSSLLGGGTQNSSVMAEAAAESGSDAHQQAKKKEDE